MFRDVPVSPFDSPTAQKSRRKSDEHDRLRRTLNDRQQRQKILRGDHSSPAPSSGHVPAVDVPRAEFLTREVLGTHGSDAMTRLRREYGPGVSPRLEGQEGLLEEVLRKRNEDFASEKDRRAAQLRKLNAERSRLLEERERIASRRHEMEQRPLSPPYDERGLQSLPPKLAEQWNHMCLRPTLPSVSGKTHGPQPVRDIVTDTRLHLPDQLERYHQLRRQFAREREVFAKPYNGELGLKSYKPSQLSHVALCRGIVEEEVERFLDSVLPFMPVGKKENDRRVLDRQLGAMTRQKVSQLIAEEILLEITSELSQATVREYHYLDSLAHNMADQLCMREAEVLATAQPFGREEKDPAFAGVVDAFYASKRDRNAKRARVWVHKQRLHTIVAANEADDPLEAEDDDLIPIEYEHFYPERLKNYEPLSTDKSWKIRELNTMRDYRKAEKVYWSAFNVSLNVNSLPKKAKGISCVSISSNDKFIAIGTQNGDLLIYDIVTTVAGKKEETSIRCLRAQHNGNVNDAAIHVSWSCDSSQVASVNQLGQVSLWTITASGSSEEDARRLNIAPDKATGVSPSQLRPVHRQGADPSDFRFSSGPLVDNKESGDKEWTPTFSVFYPSFTLLGNQYKLLYGMSSNDLLMVDTEPLSRDFGKKATGSGAQQDAGQHQAKKKGRADNLVHLIDARLEGKDPDVRVGNEELKAALFKAHKYPLIHVGFIQHVGDMFSVDRQGYINVWKHRSEQLTDKGWLRPFKKYRLAMKVRHFSPSTDTNPQVRFDEDAPEFQDTVQRNRQRNNVKAELAEFGLRHPWRTTRTGNKNIFIYKPLDGHVPESGVMFHEVYRSVPSEELAKYQTRVYKPQARFAELFLGCAQDTSASLLVCLLLFAADEDSPPCLEFVIVNLLTMKTKEPRIQVPLKNEQFQTIKKQGLVTFDVGRPLDATGAEYVFLNLVGELRIFSLASGQSVCEGIDPKLEKSSLAQPKDPSEGLKISISRFKMRPDVNLKVMSTPDNFLLLMYKKAEPSLKILQLRDTNTEEARMTTSKHFTALDEKVLYPRELRMNGDRLYFYPELHPVAGAREVIFQAMDKALQKKSAFTLETKRAHEHLNRIHSYALLSDVVAAQRKPLPYEENDDQN